MLKILIIDDEPAAGSILKLLIEKHIAHPAEIHFCSSPQEGLVKLKNWQPALLMLDIEMPGMNGFDFLNQAANWNFHVIFTTAYDKYAIQAIRFSALDYLLKPINVTDLKNAIDRHLITTEHQQALVGNLMDNLQQKTSENFKLALSTMQGVFFFDPREIIYCEGVGNYTRFHFTQRAVMLVSRTIKEFEEILNEHHFLRVHKSFLVNLNHVRKYEKEGILWLSNGESIGVSRRKKEEVKNRIFK
jgi:two-component system, LytTR family, response regulator